MASADVVLGFGRYVLTPLRQIRQDDLSPLLGEGPGVYVCNAPDGAWYAHVGTARGSNRSIEKKRQMFDRMGKGSLWLSPTFDAGCAEDTADLNAGPVAHVGYGSSRGRLAQFIQTAKMVRWLFRNRHRFGYCLVYNFDLPYFLAPLLAKLALGKRLIVDYEDDYTRYRPSTLKNAVEAILRSTVDGAICVNAAMVGYFRGREVAVSNAFADLSYARTADFGLREGMRFLFSGSLDAIRGVELVPALVEALKEHLTSFEIRISGTGPLRGKVEAWRIPEVQYLGFLDDRAYAEELARADACLILQPPDHPFSLGSYPSKVEAYAAHRKPILIVEMATMDRHGLGEP